MSEEFKERMEDPEANWQRSSSTSICAVVVRPWKHLQLAQGSSQTIDDRGLDVRCNETRRGGKQGARVARNYGVASSDNCTHHTRIRRQHGNRSRRNWRRTGGWLAALGTGLAQGRIGAAGAGAIAEKPELTGTMIVLLAIPETMIILGFARRRDHSVGEANLAEATCHSNTSCARCKRKPTAKSRRSRALPMRRLCNSSPMRSASADDSRAPSRAGGAVAGE